MTSLDQLEAAYKQAGKNYMDAIDKRAKAFEIAYAADHQLLLAGQRYKEARRNYRGEKEITRKRKGK